MSIMTTRPPECVSQSENRPGRHTCGINLCSSVNDTDTNVILNLYKLTNVLLKISIFSDNFFYSNFVKYLFEYVFILYV